MNLSQYRNRDSEVKRTADLMQLIPNRGKTALDIGARDGHFSKLLTEKYKSVTALDLEKPSIFHKNIQCVQGNITDLEFSDNSYDLVFCAEVLEHIPSQLLDKACNELSRVSKECVLIGVPFKQDIRVGRTTCYVCGTKNPPWGHVNSFDEKRLAELFPKLKICEVSFVGKATSRTNIVSTLLMDLAGNPYGTYIQEEPCIHCNNRLIPPPERGFLQKASTKFALCAYHIQRPFLREHGNWIHVLFEKRMA